MGCRMLIVILVAAVAVNLSQALLPVFKARHEKALRRFNEILNEKMAEASKRQFTSHECPIWKCYLPGPEDPFDDDTYDVRDRRHMDYDGYDASGDEDYRYDFQAMKDMAKCMSKLKKSKKLCNCTLDDIIMIGQMSEMPSIPNNDEELDADHAACWDCLHILPEMESPENLAFSCEGPKINEAQQCFAGLRDTSCLNEVMGGVEVDIDHVFDGMWLEVNGCPLHVIVDDCMSFHELDHTLFHGTYTDCKIKYARAGSSEECVRQLARSLPECESMTDDMFMAVSKAIENSIDVQCAPIQGAIETRRGCCQNADDSRRDFLKAVYASRRSLGRD